MAKAEDKKEVKKDVKEAPKADIKVLEEKYKKLFNDIVNIIQKEDNAVIVYQVLIDIVTQVESQIKGQMGGCGQNCGSCETCKDKKE